MIYHQVKAYALAGAIRRTADRRGCCRDVDLYAAGYDYGDIHEHEEAALEIANFLRDGQGEPYRVVWTTRGELEPSLAGGFEICP